MSAPGQGAPSINTGTASSPQVTEFQSTGVYAGINQSSAAFFEYGGVTTGAVLTREMLLDVMRSMPTEYDPRPVVMSPNDYEMYASLLEEPA